MLINPLLPELIAIQRRDHYLKEESLRELSDRLQIPINKIYSVASFYQAFRFTPSGKHQIHVCVGAACYVKGAESLYQSFVQYLNIKEGSDTSPDGLFTLSKVACLGCCMLAVAVQVDRHIFGHVTPEKIPIILREFLQAFEEENTAAKIVSCNEKSHSEIRICRCSSCRAAGSSRIYDSFVAEKLAFGFDYIVKEVGCHGMSYLSPLATVVTQNKIYHYDHVRLEDVRAIISTHFTPDSTLQRAVWSSERLLNTLYRGNGRCNDSFKSRISITGQCRLVTNNSGIISPESLDEYRQHGGFMAWKKTMQMSPESVIDMLIKSKLRGRGGGGFLTGEKWNFAYQSSGEGKVVICNADEGDPGAFMDRMLLESFPYRVLEGILIASKVVNAECAIIYIRDEYSQAISVLNVVITHLRNTGYFEQLAPGFDIILFRGAGAFVCGEETALLESIEGDRGIPRKRPPFPVTNGLNGMPTLINNVETFACIPMIIADNGVTFNSIGTKLSHGTKAFALAGKVKQGGLIEVPIGITIEEIVEKYGGGAENGHQIKAVMIGGPSGGCISRRRFDLVVDYDTLQTNGAMMGSGGLIVLDETDCMVDISLYFLRFLRKESCGKCVMCREGVARLCDLVEQLTHHGEHKEKLIERIEILARNIQRGSLCALGRTAPNMVLSALHEFRHEFDAHVHNQCVAGKCKELTLFHITDQCNGCTKCAQVCANSAIVCDILEQAYILPDKCVKCGICRTICPVHAIENICDSYLYTEGPPLIAYTPKFVDVDSVQIDGIKYPYVSDRILLDFASEISIAIPTLCHTNDAHNEAHCMVCAIWDASLGRFIPSCKQMLQPGHIYEFVSDRVRKFRQEVLSLMLYRHNFQCGNCSSHKKCQFLSLIREYKAKKEKSINDTPITEKIISRNVVFDQSKCIMCHRCIDISEKLLTVCGRADYVKVSTTPESWDIISRSLAEKLSNACPTGAISARNESDQ